MGECNGYTIYRKGGRLMEKEFSPAYLFGILLNLFSKCMFVYALVVTLMVGKAIYFNTSLYFLIWYSLAMLVYNFLIRENYISVILKTIISVVMSLWLGFLSAMLVKGYLYIMSIIQGVF